MRYSNVIHSTFSFQYVYVNHLNIYLKRKKMQTDLACVHHGTEMAMRKEKYIFAFQNALLRLG